MSTHLTEQELAEHHAMLLEKSRYQWTKNGNVYGIRMFPMPVCLKIEGKWCLPVHYYDIKDPLGKMYIRESNDFFSEFEVVECPVGCNNDEKAEYLLIKVNEASTEAQG